MIYINIISNNTVITCKSCRAGHSTKTANIKILDDFYAGINNKQLTIPVFLDIWEAFETICHSKLLQRLCDDFGVRGTALK